MSSEKGRLVFYASVSMVKPLHNLDKDEKPFESIHTDHLGPLDRMKQFHGHILVNCGWFY